MTVRANQNHPKKGSSIKVEPIRDLKAIKRIKHHLVDHPRDLCLFTLGINTAYRANEILSLTVGQVDYLEVGDLLDIKQRKTKKYRGVTMNRTVVDAVDQWLRVHRDPVNNATLFPSQITGQALLVPTLNNMVKKWCAEAGLRGNYGSHTLRKTWGYHQRMKQKAALPLLMEAFGHTSQAQTLDYLGIQSEEIQELYAMEL